MSKKTLRKSRDKKIFVVCAGIAEYIDVDPTFVRIVWLILTFCFGVGILSYIIAAIVMPSS